MQIIRKRESQFNHFYGYICNALRNTKFAKKKKINQH